MLYSIVYIRTITSYPMNRVPGRVAPPCWTYRLHIDRLQLLLQSRMLMASMCISNVARLRPRSVSPHSLDYGFQLHSQTRSIVASKWISKLAQLWPPNASLNLLDHGLGIYPSVHSIVIFWHPSKLGKQEYVFQSMWCLSAPVSPKHMLPVAEFISVIPVSLKIYI
jgi:hypothetical protein